MDLIGDQFMVWLSGQAGRKATRSKANAVASTLSTRFGVDDVSARRTLWNLHRAGHTESVDDGRACFVASNPVLVVNNVLSATIVLTEWIGSRARSTFSDLAERFNLHVSSSSSTENYTRIFLAGTREQLQRAASEAGGSVQHNPGLRLLRMCPPLARESFSGEQAAVPYDQPLEMLFFSNNRSSWNRVKYSPNLPPGPYRINERPIRWLWHDSGMWTAIDRNEWLWAAWLHRCVNGRATIRYDNTLGFVEIEHFGFPLPVIVDRAIRLVGGPPIWSHSHIRYNNVNTAVAESLLRVMRFARRV